MRHFICFWAILMLGVFISPILGQSIEELNQQAIVENVAVNWWQVPVFAVDKEGKPVIHLKETDIEVWINNRPVKGFTFYKRTFDLEYRQETVSKEPAGKKKQKQLIFLLFDTAMSKAACTYRSKKISKKIIKRSSPSTQFVLLSIEPFKGLNYVYGPSGNKNELLRHIDDHIIAKANDPVKDGETFKRIKLEKQPESGSGSPIFGANVEYSPDMSAKVRDFYLRKSRSFFNAFESLYLILNSIKDNKFVYFFSEGIPHDLVKSLRGGQSMFALNTKTSAQLLSRSGVVLFIVNPMGVSDDSFLVSEQSTQVFDPSGNTASPFLKGEKRSGENILRILANESGGKYMEGVQEKIVNDLDHMHRAYYEISFSDPKGLKGNIRDITIKAKTAGIKIHTLRSIEKNKPYIHLNNMEKELVALNLISNNPLFKTRIASQPVSVSKINTQKQRTLFHVRLPGEYVGKSLDLYKCWIKEDQEVVRMEYEGIKPRSSKIKIALTRKGKKHRSISPYFVLIDGGSETALVRAIGDDWIEEEQPPQRTGQKEPVRQSISPEALQKILTHAAAYCERLKESAFHFYCQEKITELNDHLLTIPRSMKPKRHTANNSDIQEQGSSRWPTRAPGNSRVEKRYTFGYRLLKNGADITEERQWLSADDKKKHTTTADRVIKPTAFFSQRAIFAPISMLASERQPRYRYRFLAYEIQKGRKAVLIEAAPIQAHQEHSIYGRIWIDREDYSILKIAADPRSIKGHSALILLEKKMKTKLQLALEIEFDNLYNGIRFPTKVSMSEQYKGGRYISKLKGPNGWLRNRTTFLYSDYRFFRVNVEVTIDDNPGDN
jgi:hypothetical protein